MLVSIDNDPRAYAWGSRDSIAEFRGLTPSGSPEAELWLGAHPGSPSRITDGVVPFGDLASWIAERPSEALGSAHARLPFLLKLLAASSPLSLQAHPTASQALAGYARENADGIPLGAAHRNYKDQFHKPELIVAISDTFDALSGFRPLDETRNIITALRSAGAKNNSAPLDRLSQCLACDAPLRTAVKWLLSDSSGVVADLVDLVVETSAAAALQEPRFRQSFETVGHLAQLHPGDPGIVLSLLLNRVRLLRGEALYLRAGNIHAYLGGLGIELMASSDNVLRGGLTEKYIDVPELLDVLDFTAGPPPFLEPELPEDGVQVFRPDVPDFLLFKIEAAGARTISLEGPAIVIAETGPILATGSSGSSTAIRRGEVVFVSADEGSLHLSGDGVVWVATTGGEAPS